MFRLKTKQSCMGGGIGRRLLPLALHVPQRGTYMRLIWSQAFAELNPTNSRKVVQSSPAMVKGPIRGYKMVRDIVRTQSHQT